MKDNFFAFRDLIEQQDKLLLELMNGVNKALTETFPDKVEELLADTAALFEAAGDGEPDKAAQAAINTKLADLFGAYVQTLDFTLETRADKELLYKIFLDTMDVIFDCWMDDAQEPQEV
jgi:hypothetical protein